MTPKNISIIGTGYVGLTLSAVLAEKGFDVTGVDTNKDLIARLNQAEPHFFEKGLSLMLRKNIREKRLRFQTDIPEIQDTYVISAGTPVDPTTKIPLMDQIQSSAQQVAGKLKKDSLVVLRSTVPLGVTRRLVKPILDQANKNYFLAFCPERTVEGKALEELTTLPQIIGGIDEQSVDVAFDLFKKVTPTIIRMSSLESAEMVKLLCNSFRDVLFAYGNEVARGCEAVGLNPMEIIAAANRGYERSKIPCPGFVGGSCLEKDPYILAISLRNAGFEPELITQGRSVNESLVTYVANRISNVVSRIEEGGKIFVSGLAFKGMPETDDLRASPSVELVRELTRKGYNRIVVHDFAVSDQKLAEEGFKPVNLNEGFTNANCVVIGNNNQKYGYLDIDDYIKMMAPNSLFFDIWGMFNPEVISGDSRIEYASIGRSVKR